MAVSAPGLPDNLIVTTSDLYLRLHGNPWYVQNYSEQELAEWSRRIKDAETDYAWVYFNNDSNAFAPGNATAFRELLTK